MNRIGLIVILIGSLQSITASRAKASYHLWSIDQVFSDASGKTQFIELHNLSAGENFLGGIPLTSASHSFTFPSTLAGDTTNRYLTLGTANLSALGFTPDYTIPANFFNPSGDTLSYGFGINVFRFTAGQLPSDGEHALTAAGLTQIARPTNYSGASATISVPEPGSFALLLAGGLGMLARRRRL